MKAKPALTENRRFLFAAWVAFICTGCFSILVTPLGEGFDETWHFGYIQHIAQAHAVPLGNTIYLSKDLALFVHSHPVPWAIHRGSPTARSYEQYWQDPDTRTRVDAALLSMRFSGGYENASDEYQYERHQPPLYYLTGAPVFSIASGLFPLVDVYLLLRLFSVLIASFVVPGAFLLAKAVLKEDNLVRSVGALVVLFPGMYPDIARISNDALVVPLVTWALYYLVLTLRDDTPAHVGGLLLFTLAGLWTKSFFVPVVIGILVTLCIARRLRVAGLLLLVSVLGVPWYLFNYYAMGSFTGLPETVSAKTTALSSVRILGSLDWKNLLNTLTSSHVWIGNWSFIQVRSWMYRLIVWGMAFAMLGIIRSRVLLREVAPLLVPYGVFLAGIVYYGTQVFQDNGISTASGWYLACFIPLEMIVFVSGTKGWFAQRWKIPAALCQLFFLVLFVYASAFVAMPYYSGHTYHAPSGHLITYQANLAEVLSMPARLVRLHPWLPQGTPWLFLAVTLTFGFYSVISTLKEGAYGARHFQTAK